MKTAIFLRLLILVVMAAPLGVLIYQNSDYFLAVPVLKVSVPQLLPGTYVSWPISNMVYWLMCLLTGLLVASCYGLVQKFKLKKQIKQLEVRLQELQPQESEALQSSDNQKESTETDMFAETVVLKEGEMAPITNATSEEVEADNRVGQRDAL